MKAIVLLPLFLAIDAGVPTAPQAPSKPKQLTATFIGNEAWHITDGEHVLLTDFPYQSGYSGYMTWDWAKVPNTAGAKTLLVVTHEHRDHFASEHLSRVQPGGVIGAAKIRAAAGAAGLTPGENVRFGPIAVRSVATPHAGLEHYSHIIDWGGVRFYLPGDTEEPDSLLQAKNLDVAFVTSWMLAAVEKRGGTIDAKQVIVVHHQSGERVKPFGGAIVPKQGDVFTFDLKASK